MVVFLMPFIAGWAQHTHYSRSRSCYPKLFASSQSQIRPINTPRLCNHTPLHSDPSLWPLRPNLPFLLSSLLATALNRLTTIQRSQVPILNVLDHVVPSLRELLLQERDEESVGQRAMDESIPVSFDFVTVLRIEMDGVCVEC